MIYEFGGTTVDTVRPATNRRRDKYHKMEMNWNPQGSRVRGWSKKTWSEVKALSRDRMVGGS